MDGYKIVGIGGANMDLSARLEGNVVPRDSNPGIITSSPGGVARNILENLCRLGEKCTLLSAVGRDYSGRELVFRCNAQGIQTDRIMYSREYPTGSYIDILGPNGDMVLASCDARIIENIPLSYFDRNRDVISSSDIIVADPNLTAEQLEYIKALAAGIPIYIDPISTSKALRIKDISGIFHFIKPNIMELSALSGIKCGSYEAMAAAVDALLEKGTEAVAVSIGAQGCYYADRKGNRMVRSPIKTVEMKNATGAGDAFMAGYIKGDLYNLSIEEKLDCAMACGLLAVESESSVNSALNLQAVEQLMNERNRT